MPKYEYQCAKCLKVQEVQHKILEEPKIECPDCHLQSRRIISRNTWLPGVGSWTYNGFRSNSTYKK